MGASLVLENETEKVGYLYWYCPATDALNRTSALDNDFISINEILQERILGLETNTFFTISPSFKGSSFCSPLYSELQPANATKYTNNILYRFSIIYLPTAQLSHHFPLVFPQLGTISNVSNFTDLRFICQDKSALQSISIILYHQKHSDLLHRFRLSISETSDNERLAEKDPACSSSSPALYSSPFFTP